MTPGWKAVCFVVAVICFALALLADLLKQSRVYAPLVALGWALFALPFAWEAGAAA